MPDVRNMTVTDAVVYFLVAAVVVGLIATAAAAMFSERR